MKFGLYVTRPKGYAILNIGDDIQSIAAMQYLPRVDELYNREASDPGGDKIKMIMNACYMNNPKCFPPSERVEPLPISMHLAPPVREAMLSNPDTARWFKKNEPIGCRDTETERFLASKGIRAYFSGCLTLTLGKKYRNSGERRGIVFVDPYIAHVFRELDPLRWLAAGFCGLMHYRTWICVAKKMKHSYCQNLKKGNLLRRLFYSAIFIKTYSQLFSLSELREAEYVTHNVKVDAVAKGGGRSVDEALLLHAESLVKKYAASSLVVTSRLHCALPCLAVGTPVLFTNGELLNTFDSNARFGGLLDLLNVAWVKGTRVAECPAFSIKNKETWKPIAEKLQKTCEEFVADV